jgi:hypothetical protein
LLEQIGHWATSNHKHVVVKTHPYTNTLHLEDYKKRFYALYSKGIDKQYFHLVCEANTDYLVDNCYMLWTTLSGVGFSALLKEKPVSYFGRDIDYNYGPIAKFCKTPEEAYDNIRLPYSEIKRYFSWYYDKLSIDLHSTDWQSTLKNRLYQYFCLRKSPYEYLSS